MAGPPSNLHGFVCTLVGMDTAEEQEIIAAARARSELVLRNPMVDRGGVVEIRPSVSCADGYQMRRVVVSAIDRENAFGGKAVDGCYDWRVDQPAVRQREKVEVVTQDVKELAAASSKAAPTCKHS